MILKRVLKYLFMLLPVSLLVTCITPFSPEGLEESGGTLVIEGDIILNGYTKVYVSESRDLDSSDPIKYHLNAEVSVLSDRGDEYRGSLVLESHLPPHYIIDTRDLPFDRNYFLRVVLVNGLRFESDYLSPESAHTPEIDAIDFVVNDRKTSVDFTVTTYGNQNTSRYYRWSFVEDWEITSVYLPTHYFDPTIGRILQYFTDPLLYYCWRQAISSPVIVAKTDHLENNSVIRQRVHTIYAWDDRISFLYSMELQQMSISKEAYTYWESMRKNTDELGGIFAPQPSEVYGNIHLVHSDNQPDIKVLGYISVGTVTSKRIFVNGGEIGIYQQMSGCDPLDTGDTPMTNTQKYRAGYRYTGDDIDEEWALLRCVDCTTRGTKNRPSFWPNNHE